MKLSRELQQSLGPLPLRLREPECTKLSLGKRIPVIFAPCTTTSRLGSWMSF